MPAKRRTILVVEDDESMRELLGLHLLGAGYAVRSVADGGAAVSACLKNIPDLVITDVHMPGIGGFEFVEALRANPRTKDVPVIFLTIDGTSLERGRELGAVAFLSKPILAGTLLATVAKVFDPLQK